MVLVGPKSGISLITNIKSYAVSCLCCFTYSIKHTCPLYNYLHIHFKIFGIACFEFRFTK